MTELSQVPTSPRPYKMSTAEFHMLTKAGAFGSYAKSELINGDVLVVTAQYLPHGMVKMELYDLLRDALRVQRSRYRPVIEFTLDISKSSAPEPDILLTNEPRGEGAVPLSSVSLVVEVSDTTLRFDQTVKDALYACAPVPEYWIADVEGRAIHQLWSPSGDAYEESRSVDFGEPLTAATILGLTITTDRLK